MAFSLRTRPRLGSVGIDFNPERRAFLTTLMRSTDLFPFGFRSFFWLAAECRQKEMML